MELSLVRPSLAAPSSKPTRVLILGGTSEATALARALAGRGDLAATMSLAGRTAIPITHSLPTRIGGFGGADGLATYLKEKAIRILVDATHPFAAKISQNAIAAAQMAGCRLVTISRPAWAPQPGDWWQEVDDMAAAAAALGDTPRRVFLTIGALQLSAFATAPHHAYLVRTINPVLPGHALAQVHFIEARGPFDVEAETRLMQEHRIDILVTKNSGGTAAVAKLDAARALGLPAIIVRRPRGESGGGDLAAAFAAIEAHQGAARRGV